MTKHPDNPVPTRSRTRAFAFAAIGLVAFSVPAWADDDTPISSIGKQLQSSGIILNGDYSGEFAANASGGSRQGGAYADQLTLGADFYLQRLADIDGGIVHLELSNRDGRNLTGDTLNNSVSAQQLYGGGQTFYLSTLTYEQKLFGDVLDVQAGRTELGSVAFQDPLYCEFQSNGICGEPAIMGKDTNTSFFPVPVWGAYATVKPATDFYALTGLFDDDGTATLPDRNGFDFSGDHANGVLIPVEAGYQTSFADDAYPRRFDIGAIFDQSPYAHTVYDAATTSLTTATDRGHSLFYIQAKQMVFRPDMNAQRGLTVFGAAAYGPDNVQPVDYSFTAGTVYQGPFASRPLDTFGVMINETHYRDNFVDQLYDYRVAALGGTERPNSNLIMAEVNYDAFATPWFDVMPNLQYIVNPDGLGGGVPYPKANLNDAFVVGVQVHINFATLAGLPSSL
ncbi:MAG TPA: carbohydrate porin [Magnetospirillaceae bacterium]|jgi:porin